MHISRITAAACGLTLSLASVGMASAATAAAKPAATTAASSSDFYTSPTDVPAQPGTLIKSERFATGISVWGNATRLMYSTLDQSGAPAAVTGTYLEPWAAWAGGGPRPVVTFSVGTIGQGDQCAPSKLMASPLGFEKFGSIAANYEIVAINNLLAKGVAVVVTDYVGLGPSDRAHTYLDREDQAHAVLDAARVASKVPGASVTSKSKVATYGYSQGGGASGAAAEVAPSYAPELDVKAGYVGAPPASLEATLTAVDGSPLTGVVGYFLNGAAPTNPAIKKLAETEVNSVGQTMLHRVAGQCTVDTLLAYGGHKTAEFTRTGESLEQILGRSSEAQAFVRAQRIGSGKPTAAVRVATGVADDVVPHAQAKQLALEWCSKGVDVTYAPIGGLSLGKKSIANHINPYIADGLTARNWVVDRLAGKPAASNCAMAAGMR